MENTKITTRFPQELRGQSKELMWRWTNFTLIELLVTIGIIAILASFLLPALKKARDMSKRTQCMNNVKTITLGFHLYAEDNDSTIPPRWEQPPSGVVPGSMWIERIYETITGDRAENLKLQNPRAGFLRCPAGKIQNGSILDSNIMKLSQYGINCFIYNRKMRMSASPSSCMITADSDEDAYYDLLLQYTNYPLGNRHSGRCSTGFIDGHVESRKTQEWIAPDVIIGSMTPEGVTITKSSGTTYNSNSLPVKQLYFWGLSASDGSFDYYARKSGNPR